MSSNEYALALAALGALSIGLGIAWPVFVIAGLCRLAEAAIALIWG